MSKKDAKSLSDILAAPKGELGHIASQARLREDLSDYLRTHLPAELAEGFMHCSLQDENTLVVVASSPERASRLRFESNRITEVCRQHGTRISIVKVRVSAG